MNVSLARNPMQQYRREEVMTASPLRLVTLVLGGAVRALERTARLRDDAAGPGAFRRELTRARGLVAELFGAVDKERGGEVAALLTPLYEYVLTQLLGAPRPRPDQIDAAVQIGRAHV